MKGLPESLTPLFCLTVLQREMPSHRSTSVRLHTPATKALASLLLLQIVLINCPIIYSRRTNQGSRALPPLTFHVTCNQADCELVRWIVMYKVISKWIRAPAANFVSQPPGKLIYRGKLWSNYNCFNVSYKDFKDLCSLICP